jgi:branched-chain amino acid transport system ATP-binding protein
LSESTPPPEHNDAESAPETAAPESAAPEGAAPEAAAPEPAAPEAPQTEAEVSTPDVAAIEAAAIEAAVAEAGPAAPAASTATGVLTVSDVTVSRGGRPVVRGVSLEIPAGEVTALLGPNGAGKSSLVLAMGGVLKLDAGSVLIDGTGLPRRPERIRHAGLAIVPEGRRLLSELTVEDNIQVAMYTLPRNEAKAGRERALAMFPELGKRLSNPARALSGGEQQMVVLAQALVSQPKFVVIDELSLGLAPVVVQRLIPTIRAVTESGIGVLLIEQFATVALGLANRVYVMEGGRIQYSGDAQELRKNPELLHSAYLMRGAPTNGGAAASTPSGSPST